LKESLFDEVGSIDYCEIDMFTLTGDTFFHDLEHKRMKICNVKKLGIKFHMEKHIGAVN